MATVQPPQRFALANWGSFIWQTLSAPAQALWLLALASIGCLLMGLIPQIPLEMLRDPTLVDLWLVSIKSPWSGAIATLHSIGLTHLIHSRLFYIYCALVAVLLLLYLVRLLIPRWAHPLGELTTEQWRLSCSHSDTLDHLERSTALVGLRVLYRRLPHAPDANTTYIQGISRGGRRWGSVLLVFGLMSMLATGIFTSWNNPPGKVVAVLPGDTLPLPGKPGTQLQLIKLSVLGDNNQVTRLISDWTMTENQLTSHLSFLPGRPVLIGETGIYLLNYGPAVHLSASDSNNQILPLQPVLGASTPQDTLRLRFDRDQQEQLVALQDSSILLRLIHYPSLPAQGITGRALHIQVLRSNTGDLLQQAYLDRSGSLIIQDIKVNIAFDYYVMVQVQNEPWLWLVILGGLVTLIGLICSLFLPKRELWLALTPSPSGTWCQVWVARSDSQASWMQTWRAMIHEVADVQP
ncbi:MAG: cytochrome c biogenesis protein ResB [Anaerolineae bacterium]